MIRVSSLLQFGVLSLSVAIFAGCGGDDDQGPERHSVSGKVTLDGQPLAQGEIMFENSEKAVSGSGTIKDGSYTLECPAAKYQVQIRSFQEVGEKDATGVGEVKNIVPAKYNEQSTLEAEIKSGENTGVNFDLKSS